MCAATRVVKVTILGRQYAFASQGEEADAHVRRVASLIDERMREVSRRSSRQAPLQVAVLTGLELVDELLKLQREADTVEEKIAERTSRLSDTLGLRLDVAEKEGAPSQEAPSSRLSADLPRTDAHLSSTPTQDTPTRISQTPRFTSADAPAIENAATASSDVDDENEASS